MIKKIKNMELINILNMLSDPTKIFPSDQILPMEIYWTYKKNIKKISEAYQLYDETRKELFEKYSITDFNQASPEAVRDVEELLNQTNEIELSSVDISKYMDIRLTPAQSDVFMATVFVEE